MNEITLREKIICGTGKIAAKTAKDHGASRATQMRIRNGSQNFYFKKYHSLERNGNHLPVPASILYRLIYFGINLSYHEASRMDKDDMAQETCLRIMGLDTVADNSPAIVVWWARRVASTYRRAYEIRKHFVALDDLYPHQEPAIENSIDPYNIDEKSLDELKEILNTAQPSDDDSDALYAAFREMRFRQEDYQCLKCERKHNLSLHHILPRRVRTENTIENTAVLCQSCHNRIEVWYTAAEFIGLNMQYQRIFDLYLRKDSKQTVSEIVGILARIKKADKQS